MDIYNHIKSLVSSKGLTLAAFADKMGITRQSLNASMKSPSYPTLVKMSETLGIPMWQLFASREEVIGEGDNCIAGNCPHCGKPITVKAVIEP